MIYAYHPPGELRLSLLYQEGDRLLGDIRGWTEIRIDRADPVILVSGQVLGNLVGMGPPAGVFYDGDLLRIEGDNRTVIYRLRGCHDLQRDLWLFTWPD